MTTKSIWQWFATIVILSLFVFASYLYVIGDSVAMYWALGAELLFIGFTALIAKVFNIPKDTSG